MNFISIIGNIAEITTSECIQLYILNKTTYSCNLAMNPNLSEYIQSILIKDDDYYVRRNLAENLNISEETQLILAEDRYFNVMRYLSRNPNICEEARRLLNENF